MTAAARWPFGDDADRDDPLTALRIPVTSWSPRWRYIATFDRESEARPTDREAQQLASYIEQYKVYFFGEGSRYKRKLEERPLDVDAVTRIFHKWGDNDWSYRVDTWQSPMWSPVTPKLRGTKFESRLRGPLTLEQVMDADQTIGSDGPMQHWLDWKAAHPDVFPVLGVDCPEPRKEAHDA